MTNKELALRKKVANTAIGFIGAKESDGSHKIIIDIYNQIRPLPRNYKLKYTDPWCAGFVSAVAAKCGLLDIMPAECSCPAMIELYKKLGRWEENDAYNANIGDVVFYDWDDSGNGDNKGVSDHVGIVTAKNGKTLTVTEGNKNDAVGTRNLQINGKYIRGYGLPNYAYVNNEIIVDDSASDDEVIIEPIPTFKLDLTELSYGMGIGNPDERVKAAQILLIGRKFSCGGAGADGEYGKATVAAVKNYQLAKKLKVDGVIGENTWKSLLGLK